LYADGYTQMEIAKMLNVNQSSITKSLNGNVDYKNGKKVYGGARKKIRKIIELDDKIKSILLAMEEVRNNKW
jgi:predicted transcriptional regulator